MQRLANAGNNALHDLMLTAESYAEIICAMEHTTPKDLKIMAAQYNNAGKLAIDLIPHLNNVESEKQTVYKMMLKVMPIEGRPLNELLDWEEVYNKYKPDPDSKLYQNLKLACEAVNELRKYVKASYMHPESNNLPSDEFKLLEQQTAALRYACKARIYQYISQSTDIQFEYSESPDGQYGHLKALLTPEVENKILTIMAETIKEFGIVCCLESSCFMKYMLYGKAKLDIVELTNVSNDSHHNGDHAFLILDNHDENNAVVADGLYGEVYPKRHLINELRDCYHYASQTRIYHFTPHYNPNYLDFKFKINPFFSRELNLAIQLHPTNIISHYLMSIMKNASYNEYFVLNTFVRCYLNDYYAKGFINQQQLSNLVNPVKTLMHVFFNAHLMQLISRQEITIDKLENDLLMQAQQQSTDSYTSPTSNDDAESPSQKNSFTSSNDDEYQEESSSGESVTKIASNKRKFDTHSDSSSMTTTTTTTNRNAAYCNSMFFSISTSDQVQPEFKKKRVENK